MANQETLTPEVAGWAAMDAANAQMRKRGDKCWNEDDYNLAGETKARLCVLGGFLHVEGYEQCIGQPFPFVQNNKGEWVKK